MRWSMLALSMVVIACSRGRGADDSARSAAVGAPAPRRPSPSEPPNDIRPSIPRDGQVAPAAGSAIDTVLGVPEVRATGGAARVAMTSASGAVTALGGPQAALIGALAGAEIWVAGARDTQGVLVVERFSVRSVDGRPARDGILERDGDGYYLRSPDGSRQVVAAPPPALRAHVGDRVWVSGPPDLPPVSFGVVEVRR